MNGSLLDIVRVPWVKSIIVKAVVPVLDWVLAPAVFVAAVLLKSVRRVGVYRMTVCRSIFFRVGVFPIRDHYYEPLFNPAHLHEPLDRDRRLPALDMNVPEQLATLRRFVYANELLALPLVPAGPGEFGYLNDNFGPGDAEFYYSLIRSCKPSRIVEIGSGFSTLIGRKAIAANVVENGDYRCQYTCIEPFEMPWLERIDGIEVVRKQLQEVDPALFGALRENDILFIDSSHVVRPQGDVVREYLELLPMIGSGTYVHVHDMFTPRDYPAVWMKDQLRLWNEQYLVEAFLSFNPEFRVVGALSFLRYHHPAALAAAFPMFAKRIEGYEPVSFWMRRR